MDTKNINPLGVIGLVGSGIVIIGVFMSWVAFDTLSLAISGWDLYTEWTDVLKTKYTLLPLADLIIGIIVMAMMMMPTFVNRSGFRKMNNILGLLTVLIAVVMLIISGLFILKDIEVLFITIHVGNHLKIGFWMTLIGYSLIVIGGFMPLVKNKLNITIKKDDE